MFKIIKTPLITTVLLANLCCLTVAVAKETAPTAVSAEKSKPTGPIAVLDPVQVEKALRQYNILVLNNYEKTLVAAIALKKAVDEFVAKPSEATLGTARGAWKQARLEYSKTEAYRFYGGPIDEADKGPEGFINAWPIDESYIDYVKGNSDSGIINNLKVYPKITSESIRGLNEKDGETNIAVGYHSVEFLLWGQDLDPNGPGRRPFTDYVVGQGMNSERRGQYLKIVSEMLVQDLRYVTEAWRGEKYLKVMLTAKPELMIQNILLGLSSLAFDEMAGERMTVAVAKNDQENEQDCFSDFSLHDLTANLLGIDEVWHKGGVREVLLQSVKNDPKLWAAMNEKVKAYEELVIRNQKVFDLLPMTFDRLVISKDVKVKNQLQSLIKGLQGQARLLAGIAKDFGLELNVQ